jgi:hypothetical protein
MLTDEDIDEDHIWNSVVDAVDGVSSVGVDDDEEDEEAAAIKANRDIIASLSVSPLLI